MNRLFSSLTTEPFVPSISATFNPERKTDLWSGLGQWVCRLTKALDLETRLQNLVMNHNQTVFCSCSWAFTKTHRHTHRTLASCQIAWFWPSFPPTDAAKFESIPLSFCHTDTQLSSGSQSQQIISQPREAAWVPSTREPALNNHKGASCPIHNLLNMSYFQLITGLSQ